MHSPTSWRRTVESAGGFIPVICTFTHHSPCLSSFLFDCRGRYEGAFFFGGTDPTSIDATVYSFLAQALYSPVSTPIQTRILELHPLHDYCERVRARYLPHKVT